MVMPVPTPVEIVKPLPLPTLDLEQIYLAIRLVDPDADVHVVVEETLAAGTSGWLTLALPATRVCIQRLIHEWGDGVVKLKWAFDAKENVAVNLHYVPPVPMAIESHKYFEKYQVAYLYRQNTDLLNTAEYHTSIDCVMPFETEWKVWRLRIKDHSLALLRGGS